MNIIFMGTPDFAVPALQALIDSAYNVIAVYSQPPRPKGRGQQIQKSPVHLLADTHNIPVFAPLSFKKDADAISHFKSLKADIAVVAAYGLILPKEVLNAPKFGCLNIHASLLPRWRGASPIQRAIWAGDTQSGITIMQMEEGLDTGPMLLKESVEMTSTTTTQKLHDELSNIGGALIIEALSKLPSLSPEKQNDALATYAKLLTKEDGKINWTQSAHEIDRQIRALNPWPGTFTNTAKGRLKILAALISSSTDKPCGTILDSMGTVACGANTSLKITTVQPDNANIMDGQSALNGGYISVDEKLS